MTHVEQVATDLETAMKCQQSFVKKMTMFQASVIVGQWDEAEKARFESHAALDAFYDNLAAAHKEMRRG